MKRVRVFIEVQYRTPDSRESLTIAADAQALCVMISAKLSGTVYENVQVPLDRIEVFDEQAARSGGAKTGTVIR